MRIERVNQYPALLHACGARPLTNYTRGDMHGLSPALSSTIEELANAVAGTYFDLVLLRVPEISEPVVERMQQDEGVLREMFESMGAKKKAVEKALRRLRCGGREWGGRAGRERCG